MVSRIDIIIDLGKCSCDTEEQLKPKNETDRNSNVFMSIRFIIQSYTNRKLKST